MLCCSGCGVWFCYMVGVLYVVSVVSGFIVWGVFLLCKCVIVGFLALNKIGTK